MKWFFKMLSITGCLALFIVIMICFAKSFNAILHPAGITGHASKSNIIASCVVVVFYILLFGVSGYKGYKSIVTAGLIFFIAPIILMFVPLGIFFCFMVAVMFQGLSFGIAGYEEIGFNFLFVMPIVIIVSYWIGKKCKKTS